MIFWQESGIVQLLMIAALLLLAAGIRRVVQRFHDIVMPDSMVAGVIGLLLGPSLMGWLPFDTDFLEGVVYHALALVFIAIGLQTPVSAKATGNARSMAIGIPLLAMIQGAGQGRHPQEGVVEQARIKDEASLHPVGAQAGGQVLQAQALEGGVDEDDPHFQWRSLLTVSMPTPARR